MKTLITVLSLLCVCSTGFGADLSVLGIEFDVPFEANVCPTLGVRGGEGVVAEARVDQRCIAPSEASKWQNSMTEVWLPIAQRPLQIKNPITVLFAEGKPNSLILKFAGLAANLAVAKLLEEKFGEPSERRKVAKQNGYGAQFEVTEADWKSENFEVLLRVSSVTNGTVYVIGPAARQESLERARNRKPSPKL